MAQTLARYRFGIDSGTEADHGWHAAENTAPGLGVIQCDTTFLLRIQVTANATHNNIDYEFQYRKNGGTWTNITTVSSNVKAVAATAFANGDTTTARLTSGGTFEDTNAGCTEDGTSCGGANDLALGEYVETECALQLVAADLANGDLIEFRLTQEGGTLLDTYSVTPSMRVAKNVAVTPTVASVALSTTVKPSKVLGTVLALACAACTLTGKAPSKLIDTPKAPGVVAVQIASAAPTVEVGGAPPSGTEIAVPVGTLQTESAAPTALTERRKIWGTVPIVQVGQAPISKAIPVGSVTLEETTPQRVLNHPRTPSVASLTLTGAAPTDHHWWEPATLTLTKGSISSGTLPLVYEADATGYLVLTESGGAAPGFTYDFEWWDVPSTATLVQFRGQYDGNPAHLVFVSQYNWNTTSWVRLTSAANDITQTTGDEWRYWELLGSTGNWVSNGTLRLRIEHTSAGNLVHTLRIDQLILTTGLQARTRVGSVALSGTTISRAQADSRQVSVGSVALTGTTPTVVRSTVKAVPVGAAQIVGDAPTVVQNHIVAVPTGTLTLSGESPAVAVSGTPISREIPTTTVSLSGVAPRKVVDHVRAVPVATVALTGTTAGRLVAHLRTPSTGTLALPGAAPTKQQDHRIGVPVGSASLTGRAPVRLVASLRTPTVGTLTLTGAAPTRLAGHLRAVPVGSVAVTSAAPTRRLAHLRTPGTGTLLLTGRAPTALTSGGDHVIAIPAGGVTLSGTTPQILTGAGGFTGLFAFWLGGVGVVAPGMSVRVSVGSVTVSTFPPVVTGLRQVPVRWSGLNSTRRFKTWGPHPELRTEGVTPDQYGDPLANRVAITGSTPTATVQSRGALSAPIHWMTEIGDWGDVRRWGPLGGGQEGPNVNAYPLTATVTLSGTVPVARVAAPVVVNVPAGSLTLSGAAPTRTIQAVARQAQVSWIELEVPDADRRLHLSWLELEVPAVATAQVSWIELEVPDAGRAVDVSWLELEVGDPPATARALDVSWLELEVPGGLPASEAPAERRGRILRHDRTAKVAAVSRTVRVPRPTRSEVV